MTPVAVTDLLGAWDAAASLGSLERSFVVLRLASGEVGHDVADMPLGERDRRLLRLRQEMFGDRLDLAIECPACGVLLEMSVPITELLSSKPQPIPPALQVGNWAVRYRMPTSADLMAVTTASSVANGREVLIDRCVLEASRDGESVPPRELPDAVLARVGESISAADPLTDLRLSLVCDGCDHAWQPSLDVGAFVWGEIDAWAWRALREVDSLARAYGWTEEYILGLSPHRRRRYLEMIGNA